MDAEVKTCKACGSSRPCPTCMGTGVYPYRLPHIVWGECGACWGTGIDHDDVRSAS